MRPVVLTLVRTDADETETVVGVWPVDQRGTAILMDRTFAAVKSVVERLAPNSASNHFKIIKSDGGLLDRCKVGLLMYEVEVDDTGSLVES